MLDHALQIICYCSKACYFSQCLDCTQTQARGLFVCQIKTEALQMICS